MTLNLLPKVNVRVSLILCFVVFTFISNSSFGQSWSILRSDVNGIVLISDNNNSDPNEDFIWILDQSSWTNGSNTEKMRLSASQLSLRVNLRMNDNDIYMRGGNDISHGLGYYGAGKLFNGVDVNGPVLYGSSGGILATVSGSSHNPVLSWKDNGNVGIGTTSPGTKLEVAGQVKITGGSPGVGKVLTSDASGLATWATPTGVSSQWTTTSSNISYNSGNVGIGTTTPTYKLHVGGGIRVENEFSMGGVDDFTIDAPNVAGGRFIVNSSGNVGIGTTTPIAKLTVSNGTMGLSVFPGYLDGTTNNAWTTLDMPGLQGLRVWDNFSVSNNVGIGTTTPELKLDVRGDGSKIGLANNGAWDHLYMFHDGATGFFRTGGAESGLAFQVNGGGSTASYGGQTYTEAMRLLGNGNVGIGTATPGTKLEVAGQVKITGGAPGVGKVLTSDASGLATWALPASTLWTATGNNIYYSPGNVGIGVTNPAFKLDVNGDFSLRNATSSLLWSGRADSDFDLIQSDNNIKRAFTIHAGNTGANVVEIYSKQSNQYQPALFVTNGAGNVGIGTGVPSAKLHVKGTMRLDSAFSMAATPTFSIDSASVAGGRFLVNTDGRVGIGVPAAKLEDNCKLSINGPTYIGDFGAGYNSGFIRDSLLSSYFLWVEKGIVSEDFAIAEVTAWDDYVFNEDYQLPSLSEIDAFIKANKHLPNIPSEAEVKKDGYSLHKLNRGLLKTIEEQTLHVIQQEKKISALENKVTELEATLNQYKQLAAEVAALKAIMLENVSKK